MLYEAKQGTKAYEYIKGILETEEKEYQAYMKRVDEAVGFKFEPSGKVINLTAVCCESIR